jgi:hypothetical protein
MQGQRILASVLHVYISPGSWRKIIECHIYLPPLAPDTWSASLWELFPHRVAHELRYHCDNLKRKDQTSQQRLQMILSYLNGGWISPLKNFFF